MRPVALLLALIACGPSKPETTMPAPPATGVEEPVATKPVEPPAAPEPAAEVMAADTPKTTTSGNPFVAPLGWSVKVKGSATILSSPENDSHVVLADVAAPTAPEAAKLAWAAYGKQAPAVDLQRNVPDSNGWSKIEIFNYAVSPNEKRFVQANARFANEMWTVVIVDAASGTLEKRNAQLGVMLGQLLPKGFERETFANKKANALDATRIAAISKYIENGQQLFDVPGVAVGIVQDGKVVFAGGFGVREKGKPAKVDGDTRFIIASNTKAMTTLMLAKLVEEKKLTWETPATQLLPQFKLGDADTTGKVLVKHLICACTGLPRRDLEMIFEASRYNTPDKTLEALATMQPTSKFGELFQYSNPLASAAGYLGGHVAFPKLELGKAYDEAMRTRVFEPLGMKTTTFDFKRARTGNFAVSHTKDVDDKSVASPLPLIDLVVPARPAGGAWSSVKDVLKYVQMELSEGKLPNGKQYIAKDTLFARRVPQVATSKESGYGMGLSISQQLGITVIEHGGAITGYHSTMLWLPEHNVGAVLLTNADGGAFIRGNFKRKLLEVLFDGKPEADANIAAAAKNRQIALDAGRKQMTIPADDAEAGKLAASYENAALGPITVTRAAGKTTFDFGEFKSEMATRKNPDGTLSFITIIPGLSGVDLVVGTANGKRTLTMRDSQHEYVFAEK
jgi:CubicO group peptidase (beta-lactamase class C family)